MTSAQHRDRPIPSWQFWVPLVLQVLLVLTIPAQAIYAHISGTDVVLQTVPVDPYSLLQGYYVILRYDISLPETLEPLPGWDELGQPPASDPSAYTTEGTHFYVVLEPPQPDSADLSVDAAMPLPWTPVRVAKTRPTDLPDPQVMIKGYYQAGRITYGLEQYFIPEDQRNEINDRINQAQQSGDRPAYVVNVKVSSDGTATPVSLWVDGFTYRF